MKILTSFLIAGLILTIGVQAEAKQITGDINRDSKVDIVDLSILLNAYETNGKKCTEKKYTCDLNKDKTIDIVDLSILLANWTNKDV